LGNFNLVQEFDISTLLRHFFPDQGGRTRQNKTSAPQKWGEKRKILQQLRPERPPDFFSITDYPFRERGGGVVPDAHWHQDVRFPFDVEVVKVVEVNTS